jgi:hypothetical protein
MEVSKVYNKDGYLIKIRAVLLTDHAETVFKIEVQRSERNGSPFKPILTGLNQLTTSERIQATKEVLAAYTTPKQVEEVKELLLNKLKNVIQ